MGSAIPMAKTESQNKPKLLLSGFLYGIMTLL
nr:MAG TPA: hypothetical protein [Siphoviridae sp. ctX8T1]